MSTSPILETRLPLFRTKLSDPFVVTGVDFEGPVYFKIIKSNTAKAYIALFTCASTRAVHLKLCRNLSATKFQRALKNLLLGEDVPRPL